MGSYVSGRDDDEDKGKIKYSGLFRKEALDARFEYKYGHPFDSMPLSWTVLSALLVIIVASTFTASFFVKHTNEVFVYGELNSPAANVRAEEPGLVARLYVPPRAAAAMKVGQSVVMNYDALPYQYYGKGEGTVVAMADLPATPPRLQPDLTVSQPVYVAIVRLKAQSVYSPGKAVPLKAGMTLRAAVVLDQRSVASWLLDPFYQMHAN